MKLLVLLSCLLLSASSISAQAEIATDVRKGFEEVNDWVTKAADMVPADKYSYRPVDTLRTFGELIAHIADSYNYFCAHAVGNKVEWLTPIEKGKTDKDTVLPRFKEAVGK